MKKATTAALSLCLAALMLLSACAPAPANGSESPQPSQSGEPAQTGEINPADVKVGLVLGGALGDQSVHDQANAGLEAVKEEYGVQTKVVECSDSSMYVDAMQRLCEEGYDLIVLDEFGQEEALRAVAPSYPEVNFMILDTVVDLDNVASFTYATHECAFLAGAAAALKAVCGVVGFIGGMEFPTIQKDQKGYEEGVAYVNPDAQVISKYVGNDANAWSNPAQAKSLTLDAIANGADVCFHAADGSGLGMIEACDEKSVYSIGVNIDQSHLAPETVLTSALTRGDVAIQLFVESYLEGEVLTGETVLTCANDGVGIVMSDFFTAEEQETLNDIRDKIISGEIVVTNILA